MTATEMRELDAWIAEHVMGCKPSPETSMAIALGEFYITKCSGEVIAAYKYQWPHEFHPTEDPSAAFEVLKKCAEKLSEHWAVAIEWQPIEEKWRVVQSDKYKGIEAEAKTLELAIALFAKQLFGDHDKKRKAA